MAGNARINVLCHFLLRITGLEPARRGHQNLNLARLPIPPYPLVKEKSPTQKVELQVKHRGFEPRTT